MFENCGLWSDSEKNALYLFGGCYEPEDRDSSNYGFHVLPDLWRYDIDSGVWTHLPMLGNFPGPRAEFGVYETSGGAIIHGGFNHGQSHWVPQHNHLLKGSFFNDTFIFDNKSETWKMVSYKVTKYIPFKAEVSQYCCVKGFVIL